MNAKHPIDELFARGLSDAEVTPPPAVWEGIARQRGWGHRTLLRLQRRWALLGLLLLFAGGGAAAWYYAIGTTADGALATAEAPTPNSEAVDQPMTSNTVITSTAAAPPQAVATSEVNSAPNDAPAAPASASEAPRTATPSRNSSTATNTTTRPQSTDNAAETNTKSSIHPRADAGPDGVVITAGTAARTNPTTTAPGVKDNTVESPNAPATKASSEQRSGGSASAKENKEEVKAIGRSIWYADAPHWIAPLSVTLPSTIVAGEPVKGQMPAPLNVQKGWWSVGASIGMYAEDRTWKGSDVDLVNGLNDTETPHYPYSVGLSLARQWRSGWQAMLGVEYSMARFDGTHTERLEEWREVVQPGIVVLLDSVVVAVTNDTSYLTLVERQNQITAKNTVTGLRVPLEAGYSFNVRRWIFGLRAGAALEFVRSRSNFTIDLLADDGTSVYRVPVERDHNNTIVCASLSPTIGFRLTEHLQLAAEGVFMRGLGALGAQDAYVVPDRFGARLRLSYTLPHK